MEDAEYENKTGEDENTLLFGLGRGSEVLKANRIANGGIDDDPTDSGDPVRNKTPFKNLTGGR
jgi:hypothetical protein